MLFFLKHKFSSYWMVQETSGLRKPTLLGVDPQNEFHLSKQVSFAYRMTSWFTRKLFLESNALSPFILDKQWSYGLVPAKLSTLPTHLFCPLALSSHPQFQPTMFTRPQLVNRSSNEPIHLFSRKWPLELLHVKPIDQSYIWQACNHEHNMIYL